MVVQCYDETTNKKVRRHQQMDQVLNHPHYQTFPQAWEQPQMAPMPLMAANQSTGEWTLMSQNPQTAAWVVQSQQQRDAIMNQAGPSGLNNPPVVLTSQQPQPKMDWSAEVEAAEAEKIPGILEPKQGHQHPGYSTEPPKKDLKNKPSPK
jgi:hypothetical protein